MVPLVTLDDLGDVHRVTLDRSDRHNSLVPAFVEQVRRQVHRVAGIDDTILLITAAGPSFSTGGDIRAFYEHRDDLAAYGERLVGSLNALIVELLRCDHPILTAVDGPVTGGSVGILLASDLVFVSPAATITPYYTEIGFSPDGGWTAMMPSVIGRMRTVDVLLRNRTVTPEQAVEWGLAAAMVREVEAHTNRVAEELAAGRREALRSSLDLLRPDPETIENRLARERRAFVEQVQTREARAGILAFLGEDEPSTASSHAEHG